MIDTTLAQLALRGRALTLSVATTGSTSLSATTAGYARAAGSFVADGFAVGMELLASGFSTPANNGYAVVTSVSATALGIAGGRTAESAGAGKSLAVGLPEGRAWENTAFSPVAGRPYVEEDMVPATTQLITYPADGGWVEEAGLYVLRLYGLSGTGIAGLRKTADALKQRYAPGTALTLSGGGTVRVRTDTGPFAGQPRPVEGGWSVITLTVPWRARSVNAVAA